MDAERESSRRLAVSLGQVPLGFPHESEQVLKAMTWMAQQGACLGGAGVEADGAAGGGGRAGAVMTVPEFLATMQHIKIPAECGVKRGVDTEGRLSVDCPPLQTWAQATEVARWHTVELTARGESVLPPPLTLALVMWLQFTGLNEVIHQALTRLAVDGLRGATAGRAAAELVMPFCEGVSQALKLLPALNGQYVYAVAMVADARAFLNVFRQGRTVFWPSFALATSHPAVALAWVEHLTHPASAGAGGSSPGAGKSQRPSVVVLKIRSRTGRSVEKFRSAYYSGDASNLGVHALGLTMFGLDTALTVEHYNPLDLPHLLRGLSGSRLTDARGSLSLVGLDNVPAVRLSSSEARERLSGSHGAGGVPWDRCIVVELKERQAED